MPIEDWSADEVWEYLMSGPCPFPKGRGGDGGEREKRLFESELKRITELAKLAGNFSEIWESLRPIIEEYDLEADFINGMLGN